jgi:hypothetical protein
MLSHTLYGGGVTAVDTVLAKIPVSQWYGMQKGLKVLDMSGDFI